VSSRRYQLVKKLHKNFQALGDGAFLFTPTRQIADEEFLAALDEIGFCAPIADESQAEFIARNLYIEAMYESDAYENRKEINERWTTEGVIPADSRNLWILKAKRFLERMPNG
jgi:hypothetical protein